MSRGYLELSLCPGMRTRDDRDHLPVVANYRLECLVPRIVSCGMRSETMDGVNNPVSSSCTFSCMEPVRQLFASLAVRLSSARPIAAIAPDRRARGCSGVESSSGFSDTTSRGSFDRLRLVFVTELPSSLIHLIGGHLDNIVNTGCDAPRASRIGRPARSEVARARAQNVPHFARWALPAHPCAS